MEDSFSHATVEGRCSLPSSVLLQEISRRLTDCGRPSVWKWGFNIQIIPSKSSWLRQDGVLHVFPADPISELLFDTHNDIVSFSPSFPPLDSPLNFIFWPHDIEEIPVSCILFAISLYRTAWSNVIRKAMEYNTWSQRFFFQNHVSNVQRLYTWRCWSNTQLHATP